MGTHLRWPRAGFLTIALFLLACTLPARAQDAPPRAAQEEAANRAERNAALELYRARLVQTCAKLRGYPEEAQRQGLTGAATVFLEIGADGRVSEEYLAKSSGHGVLDTFALDVLKRAVPLTQIPAALHNSAFEVAVVMVFALPQNEESGGVQARNAAPKAVHHRAAYLQNE